MKLLRPTQVPSVLTFARWSAVSVGLGVATSWLEPPWEVLPLVPLAFLAGFGAFEMDRRRVRRELSKLMGVNVRDTRTTAIYEKDASEQTRKGWQPKHEAKPHPPPKPGQAEIMEDDERFQEVCWRLLPVDLRERAVAHLRAKLPPEFLAWVRKRHAENPTSWWAEDQTPPEQREEIRASHEFYIPTPFHSFAGMGVRNQLREVIRDDELPSAPYDDDRGDYRNWDDYYVQVLEAAAGVRVVAK